MSRFYWMWFTLCMDITQPLNSFPLRVASLNHLDWPQAQLCFDAGSFAETGALIARRFMLKFVVVCSVHADWWHIHGIAPASLKDLLPSRWLRLPESASSSDATCCRFPCWLQSCAVPLGGILAAAAGIRRYTRCNGFRDSCIWWTLYLSDCHVFGWSLALCRTFVAGSDLPVLDALGYGFVCSITRNYGFGRIPGSRVRSLTGRLTFSSHGGCGLLCAGAYQLVHALWSLWWAS